MQAWFSKDFRIWMVKSALVENPVLTKLARCSLPFHFSTMLRKNHPSYHQTPCHKMYNLQASRNKMNREGFGAGYPLNTWGLMLFIHQSMLIYEEFALFTYVTVYGQCSLAFSVTRNASGGSPLSLVIGRWAFGFYLFVLEEKQFIVHWEKRSRMAVVESHYLLAAFVLSIQIYSERVRSLISCGIKDYVIPISWLHTGNQDRNGFLNTPSLFRLLFFAVVIYWQ